jgi:hypothetical protein
VRRQRNAVITHCVTIAAKILLVYPKLNPVPLGNLMPVLTKTWLHAQAPYRCHIHTGTDRYGFLSFSEIFAEEMENPNFVKKCKVQVI